MFHHVPVSTDVLNVLPWVLHLDLHGGSECDFEVITQWSESVDNINLRPDSVDIWSDPLVGTVSGVSHGFWTLTEVHCMHVIWIDLG